MLKSKGSPFTVFLATRQILRLLRKVWIVLLIKNAYSLSKLSFLLSLTIYSFCLLLFLTVKPYNFMTKEAAISEKRDVSHGAGEKGRPAGCPSSLAAASGKYLWSMGISHPFFPHLHPLIGTRSSQIHLT